MIVEFLDLFLKLNLQPSSIEDGEVDTVAGGCAYFTERFKDYNSFEIESWLPLGEDHQPLACRADAHLRNQALLLFQPETKQLEMVGLPY